MLELLLPEEDKSNQESSYAVAPQPYVNTESRKPKNSDNFRQIDGSSKIAFDKKVDQFRSKTGSIENLSLFGFLGQRKSKESPYLSEDQTDFSKNQPRLTLRAKMTREEQKLASRGYFMFKAQRKQQAKEFSVRAGLRGHSFPKKSDDNFQTFSAPFSLKSIPKPVSFHSAIRPAEKTSDEVEEESPSDTENRAESPSSDERSQVNVSPLVNRQVDREGMQGYAPKRMAERPIKIIFEKSFLMDSMNNFRNRYTKQQKDRFMSKIIDLIQKTNAFLRNYIFSVVEERTITIPENYDNCVASNDNLLYKLDKRKLNSRKQFKADLLIFVYAMDEPNRKELASAMPCKSFPDGTSQFGTLRINVGKVLSPENIDNKVKMKIALNVIIHEIFHIIAFHESVMKNFESRVNRDFPFLSLFTNNNVPSAIEKNAHWSDRYIFNDLMVPTERSDSLLSIFSLEYIELANKDVYKTRRNNLQTNPLLDKVKNWSHFFNYKCENNAFSAYPNYCSKKQVKERQWSCDPTRLYTTVCEDDPSKLLPNNCFKNNVHDRHICIDADTEREDDHFSYYGFDSRCFESTNSGATYCLKQKVESGKLMIIVGSKTYECKRKNEVLQVTSQVSGNRSGYYQTEIICPDPNEFIANYEKSTCPEFCNLNGVCDNGKCVCFEGFSSADNCRSRTSSQSSTFFADSYVN